MISAADLRVLIGLAADDASEDAVLWPLEAEAVAWVQRRTLRYFGPPAEITERLTGDGSVKLRLAEAPYTDDAITDPATIDEYAYVGAAPTTITGANADGFEVVKRVPEATNLGWLERKGGYVWTCGYLYVVTYTRGYALTAEGAGGAPDDVAAPDDIRALVKGIVRFRHAARERDPGLISETIGNYSYSAGAIYQSEGAMVNQIPGAAETLRRWTRPVYA